MSWRGEKFLTCTVIQTPAIQPVAITTKKMPSITSLTHLAMSRILVIVQVIFK
jgi:hypothetical protein